MLPRQCAMLAYRHAFHAGNHADVLKHVVLVHVLRWMAQKDKPFTLVDTHAGAGGYALASGYAQKKGEYHGGIEPLWGAADLPPPLADYVALVRAFNGGGALAQYPGSPAFAQMLLRPGDRLRLFELHPTDHRIVAAYLGERAHTAVAMADGFAALAKELPPPSRRGVVLIDPSYELKTDYARVVAALREALQRFATGTVLVWHPQVQLVEAAQLPRRLKAAAKDAPKGWLHATLHVAPPQPGGFGMTGSGMFVVNPPHTLHAALAQALPVLAQRLGQYDGARFELEQAGG
jgi:23S rRNA (adenine2030-N6)-methyltransferase